MYCKNCGREVEDFAKNCIYCGTNLNQGNAQVDTGNICYGFLGCCIPLVGLILFLVWKDTKPKSAKAAGIGALIAVCCSVAWYILVGFLGFLII